MVDLFDELTSQKHENNLLTVKNIELSSKFNCFLEENNSLREISDIKEESVVQLRKELAAMKDTMTSLRNSNNEKSSLVRTLEVDMLILQEEKMDIHNQQETRINKLSQKEGLILRQVEMIDSLSLELQNERKENE